jgi:hypothetical protein
MAEFRDLKICDRFDLVPADGWPRSREGACNPPTARVRYKSATR